MSNRSRQRDVCGQLGSHLFKLMFLAGERNPLPPPPLQFLLSSLEAYESVASFATAYSIGKVESKAAINLLRNIPQQTKEGLTELVRLALAKPTYIKSHLMGYVNGVVMGSHRL